MNTHLKQLWAAMRLPENFKKSYKFFCRGLDIRVPQIVETNLPHTVLFKHQREMLGDIAGFYKLSDLVDIDIIGVLPAIRPAAQLSV